MLPVLTYPTMDLAHIFDTIMLRFILSSPNISSAEWPPTKGIALGNRALLAASGNNADAVSLTAVAAP